MIIIVNSGAFCRNDANDRQTFFRQRSFNKLQEATKTIN